MSKKKSQKNFKTQILKLALFLVCCSVSFSQTEKEPQWISGKGNATGTDIESMRTKALNDARSDALSKAGIVVQSGDIYTKTEGNDKLTDFYSKFAETQARGLILEERNIEISEPKRISPQEEKKNILYQIEIQLEALVAPQNGEPDAGFEVTISTKKEIYIEEEAVEFEISSSRSGFLTIFNIHGDSLDVIFPNALDKQNKITAHLPFTFPANKAYSLTLETLPGKQNSQDEFIAVVTKENIPFQNVDNAMIDTRGVLKIKEAQLISFANWLYKIPLQTRASAKQIITVQKKLK
ncbi:MAG: DUF4384 domain-containing protein [Bacteroidota bacterium]